jgi:hypothetical protein
MEDKVYVCAWERSAAGYRLWVKSRQGILGEGRSYEEAEERLLDAIRGAGGAMQAVLEFDPPLPKSALEAKYSQPAIFKIGADDTFTTDEADRQRGSLPDEEGMKPLDAYYRAPLCRACQYTAGPRSDKPLTLTSAPSRYDGAFGHVGRYGTMTIQIVAQEFLDLLSPEERGPLELRPVNRKGKGKGRLFFELLGPAGPPFVAVSGLKISGWRCQRCRTGVWGYWVPGMEIHSFVARSDLPGFLPGVFTLGTPPEVCLAATAQRWKQLVGQKGTRGFVSEQIGVAPERDVIRDPELPVR